MKEWAPILGHESNIYNWKTTFQLLFKLDYKGYFQLPQKGFGRQRCIFTSVLSGSKDWAWLKVFKPNVYITTAYSLYLLANTMKRAPMTSMTMIMTVTMTKIMMIGTQQMLTRMLMRIFFG